MDNITLVLEAIGEKIAKITDESSYKDTKLSLLENENTRLKNDNATMVKKLDELQKYISKLEG